LTRLQHKLKLSELLDTVALYMLEVPAWLAGLVISCALLWALGYAAVLPLRRSLLKELRGLSTNELTQRTFQYPTKYFEYIGESHPSVIRFREIVEAKDLSAMSREWKSLEKDFLKLEHQAGHSGRPLIMDYLFWHDLNIKALRERQRRS